MYNFREKFTSWYYSKGYRMEYKPHEDGVAELVFRCTRLEQIRRHKKKRINKKWAKRYGYREVRDVYEFENAHIEHELFNDF